MKKIKKKAAKGANFDSISFHQKFKKKIDKKVNGRPNIYSLSQLFFQFIIVTETGRRVQSHFGGGDGGGGGLCVQMMSNCRNGLAAVVSSQTDTMQPAKEERGE